MAIIVEDGSIVANANSYVSEADLLAYAVARGITLQANTEILLIKSMDYIETLNFIGNKVSSTQPLQWPRADVYIDGYPFPMNEIPQLLKNGLMQTALSIDANVDPQSNIDRQIQSATVGPVSVTYEKGISATIIRKINAQLAKLLDGVAGYSFPVYRGS